MQNPVRYTRIEAGGGNKLPPHRRRRENANDYVFGADDGKAQVTAQRALVYHARVQTALSGVTALMMTILLIGAYSTSGQLNDTTESTEQMQRTMSDVHQQMTNATQTTLFNDTVHYVHDILKHVERLTARLEQDGTVDQVTRMVHDLNHIFDNAVDNGTLQAATDMMHHMSLISKRAVDDGLLEHGAALMAHVSELMDHVIEDGAIESGSDVLRKLEALMQTVIDDDFINHVNDISLSVEGLLKGLEKVQGLSAGIIEQLLLGAPSSTP
jgi:hypothetical protein